MNREVEKLLPAALVAVRTHLMGNPELGIVHKEYDGYAANLGGAIRQSGLLPALSFFTDVHKMKAGNQDNVFRHKLLVAILSVLGETLPTGNNPYETKQLQGRELLRQVIQSGYGADVFQRNTAITIGNPTNPGHLTTWQHRILVASVAIKLALRTYVHTGSDLAQNEQA